MGVWPAGSHKPQGAAFRPPPFLSYVHAAGRVLKQCSNSFDDWPSLFGKTCSSSPKNMTYATVFCIEGLSLTKSNKIVCIEGKGETKWTVLLIPIFMQKKHKETWKKTSFQNIPTVKDMWCSAVCPTKYIMCSGALHVTHAHAAIFLYSISAIPCPSYRYRINLTIP